MNLNQQSRLPLYQQLADKLRMAMERGVYAVAEKIPSENELAQQYGVGRPTVRQATDLLVREGRLQRRRGAGTFVLPPSRHIDLFSLAGTSAAFRESGVYNEMSIIMPLVLLNKGQVVAHTQLPDSLRQCSLYFFKRLCRVERLPVLLEAIYLDAGLFNGLERFTLENDSLARIVRESFSLEATQAEQTFSIARADAAMADMLEIRHNQPLLHVGRRLHFGPYQDGVYCDIYCRTDHFNFSQTITTPASP